MTSTKGNVNTSNMALATALFGPLGLAAGAKTSSTSTARSVITRLALKIYVSDLHAPRFEIPFIVYPSYLTNDPATKQAIALAEDWYGRFRAILAQVERNGANVDRPKAIEHDGPIPLPVQRPWASRVFGA